MMRCRTTIKPASLLMGLVLATLLAFNVYTAQPAQAGEFITREYNGRIYKVFIPDGYQAGTPVPMVVMLHGCTQNPDDFAAGTQMNVYADQFTFIAVYPDQPSSSNANKCWNWFEPAHQGRGSGEPHIIVSIMNEVKRDWTIDDSRVYVAGMSAGAAMSVILGATYPDVFAAIGESAGLEYKAAHDLPSALLAQTQGGPDPNQQGIIAYQAMGEFRRVVPVIAFHGNMDVTVAPVNLHQVITQWAQTNDLASDGVDDNNIDDIPESTLPGQVPGGYAYTRYVYNNSTNGQQVMEKYLVEGMRHAWSGGSASGSYTDPRGPNASLLMWEFFVAHPRPGAQGTPTTIPTASPTATLPPNATLVPTQTARPSATLPPGATASPQASATPTGTCSVRFSDVPSNDPFYPYVRCLACQGVITGYSDGSFRPSNNVTRGQLSKIVANAARMNDTVSGQMFEDVPPSHTFYEWIQRLAGRGIMGGYECGGPGEPCVNNRPYFRPQANATRGQISKIVSEAARFSDPPGAQVFEDVPPGSTFYDWIQRLSRRGHISGYECGSPGEPCGQSNRPYFRPNNNATRAQTAKIVSNVFNCELP